ncbi:hypothetical protein GC173_18175 [bacterium]|nr:hypothetical protein [bacterium]
MRSMLAWKPPQGAADPIFLGMIALIAFWATRSILWAQTRLAPEIPTALVSEQVDRPKLPHVPSSLPRVIRLLDTTGDLRVHEREIVVSGLGPLFDGFRIVHVADVHFGQRLEMENYLRAVRELVVGLNGDVVVLTGDFVNRRRDIVRSMAYHAELKGRLGTLAVLGNHDYWTRPERIIDELGARGVRWLGGGDRRSLKRGGRRLVFVGTDAPWNKERPNFDRLIRRNMGDAVILLSHTPDNAPSAARAGASLILSGHNHGGQMCLPLIGPFVVPSRHGLAFAGGLYRVGADSLLNVSRGVGVSSGGCRLLCPPEITVLTLRAPHVEVMAGKIIPAKAVFRGVAMDGWQAAGERC